MPEKVTVISVSAAIEMVQVGAVVQELAVAAVPLHPVKVDPALAVAVSVTEVSSDSYFFDPELEALRLSSVEEMLPLPVIV